ncbi:transmembrane protein 230 [Eurosta solidaginis]|uniref:transmembrane protein 230 n=1 Tax=Eurosta solidaginis TaxID=178769 RepID=UPI00353178E7
MPVTRRRRAAYESIQTEDIDGEDDVDSYGYDYQDKQFISTYEEKLPWKTISFVIFFLIVGMICMTTAGLIFTEIIDQTYVDRASPLLILGSLMVIPGGYYSFILASIIMKREGYSWEDIPEL